MYHATKFIYKTGFRFTCANKNKNKAPNTLANNNRENGAVALCNKQL